jgi:rhodanese-related sulfurtransferase
MTLITSVGVALGLGWNSLSGQGFDLSESVFVQAGDELVSAPEAKARLDAGALFLDARPRDFWRMNRIPGSHPLPEDDFEAAFAEAEPLLRKTTNIVVYCSGYGCEASHIVSRRLRERGYPAAILDEGLPAWEDEEYPVDTEARP